MHVIKHDVHVLSEECCLTFAESIAVDFISLLKGLKDLVNPASQDNGHLCRSLMIHHWQIYPGTRAIQNNIGNFGG